MDPTKVYIIDEDGKRRERLAEFLAGLAFNIKTQNSIAEFISQSAGFSRPALALIGMASPTEEAVGALQRLKKIHPYLPLIVLSDAVKEKDGVALLREGIIDQLAGLSNWAGIYSALRSEIIKMRLLERNTSYSLNLKRLKAEQMKNQRKASELEEIYNATLENLMTAMDLRDVETFGHSLTVAKYSQALAQLLGIKDETTLDNIRKGALLHDIGKIAIPDAILKKPSRLSAAEWEKVKLHPVLGYGLIREIKMVKEVGNVILYHHERYDGKGYPKGLKKETIPLEARIFALADALDAITSHRPYRKERDFKAAKRDIQENRGTQFDPKVVDAFCSVKLEDWEKIRYETTKILPNLENFSELYGKP